MPQYAQSKVKFRERDVQVMEVTDFDDSPLGAASRAVSILRSLSPGMWCLSLCAISNSFWGTCYPNRQGWKGFPPNVGNHLLNYMSLHARKNRCSYICKWQRARATHRPSLVSVADASFAHFTHVQANTTSSEICRMTRRRNMYVLHRHIPHRSIHKTNLDSCAW